MRGLSKVQHQTSKSRNLISPLHYCWARWKYNSYSTALSRSTSNHTDKATCSYKASGKSTSTRETVLSLGVYNSLSMRIQTGHMQDSFHYCASICSIKVRHDEGQERSDSSPKTAYNEQCSSIHQENVSLCSLFLHWWRIMLNASVVHYCISKWWCSPLESKGREAPAPNITLTSLVHVSPTAKWQEIKVQRELWETLPVFSGPGVFPSSTSASAVPAMY